MISQIIFRYFDRKSAAIKVLRDYKSMEKIIKNTKGKILDEQMKMYSLGSFAMDGMPHAHNLHSREDRITNSIDKIDFLKDRYEAAREYMSWVNPAWHSLTEEEQYLLSQFYFDEDARRDNLITDIADRMCICTQSVYNKKNKALEKFTMLLFGVK